MTLRTTTLRLPGSAPSPAPAGGGVPPGGGAAVGAGAGEVPSGTGAALAGSAAEAHGGATARTRERRQAEGGAQEGMRKSEEGERRRRRCQARWRRTSVQAPPPGAAQPRKPASQPAARARTLGQRVRHRLGRRLQREGGGVQELGAGRDAVRGRLCGAAHRLQRVAQRREGAPHAGRAPPPPRAPSFLSSCLRAVPAAPRGELAPARPDCSGRRLMGCAIDAPGAVQRASRRGAPLPKPAAGL